MHILWLSPVLPFPPTDGNRMRNFYLIKNLSEEHEISLIHFYTTDDTPNNDNPIYRYCKNIEGIEIRRKKEESVFRLVDKIWNELFGVSTFCSYGNRKEMRDRVSSFCKKNKIDIIVTISPWMGEFAAHIKNIPKILDNQNVEALLLNGIFKAEKRIKTKLAKYLDYQAMARYENRIIKFFDMMTVVSSGDKKNFVNNGFDDDFIKVVPNGVQISEKEFAYSQNGSSRLIFCGGMSYPPNVEGVNYFMTDIYPKIKKILPQLKVSFVGKLPHPDVVHWQSEHVEITGFVDDVLPYYRKSAVSIVPLKTGSGTRLKILESMALGVPIVSTSLGSSGLSVKNNENIILADDPDSFAKGVLNLIKNPRLSYAISKNARKLVESRYDWFMIAKGFNRILLDVVNRRKQKDITIQPRIYTAWLSPQPKKDKNKLLAADGRR